MVGADRRSVNLDLHVRVTYVAAHDGLLRVKPLSTLPNAITLGRIALTPVFILFLKNQDYASALVVFLIAGFSDGLDGFIAKRYNSITRLGGLLDPLADKILLVSAYVMLSLLDKLPFWLVLSVTFRDLLIIGAYLVYTSVVGPVRMRPSRLSKVNTVAQVALILAILFEQAQVFAMSGLVNTLIYIVLATTLASGLHYLWIWGVMKDIEPMRGRRR